MANITVTNTFTNGTTADAKQVMLRQQMHHSREIKRL